MPLLPFSFDTEVTPETARQDRIHVDLGVWELRGSTEEIDILRERLCLPPENARDLNPLRPGGPSNYIESPFGRLFQRPQQHGRFRSPLKIRETSVEIEGETVDIPLFSGRLVFSGYAREDLERQTRSYLTLELWVNPTRYVRHQPICPLPDPSIRGGYPEPQLFRKNLPHEIFGEFALDGRQNDNWIPNTPRRQLLANSDRWKGHVRNYLDGITSLFDEELSRVRPYESSVQISNFNQKLNLRVVETYWEFTSESPTVAVASLRSLFQAFTRRHQITHHYAPIRTETITHNCLMLSGQISAGTELRIYAKTNLRVRVEVKHTLEGRSGHRLINSGGHTSEDRSAVHGMLEELAEDAAELVNTAFSFFRGQSSAEPPQVSAFQLLMEICHGSRNRSAAIQIASLLVCTNAIYSSGINKAIKRSLHNLSRTGILEYHRFSGCYTITEPRRHALQMLQQNGGLLRMIGGRIRTRR